MRLVMARMISFCSAVAGPGEGAPPPGGAGWPDSPFAPDGSPAAGGWGAAGFVPPRRPVALGLPPPGSEALAPGTGLAAGSAGDSEPPVSSAGAAAGGVSGISPMMASFSAWVRTGSGRSFWRMKGSPSRHSRECFYSAPVLADARVRPDAGIHRGVGSGLEEFDVRLEEVEAWVVGGRAVDDGEAVLYDGGGPPEPESSLAVRHLLTVHLDQQGRLEAELRLGLHLDARLDEFLFSRLLVLLHRVAVTRPAADDHEHGEVEVEVGPLGPAALDVGPVLELQAPALGEVLPGAARVDLGQIRIAEFAPGVGHAVGDGDGHARLMALLGPGTEVIEGAGADAQEVQARFFLDEPGDVFGAAFGVIEGDGSGQAKELADPDGEEDRRVGLAGGLEAEKPRLEVALPISERLQQSHRVSFALTAWRQGRLSNGLPARGPHGVGARLRGHLLASSRGGPCLRGAPASPSFQRAGAPPGPPQRSDRRARQCWQTEPRSGRCAHAHIPRSNSPSPGPRPATTRSPSPSPAASALRGSRTPGHARLRRGPAPPPGWRAPRVRDRRAFRLAGKACPRAHTSPPRGARRRRGDDRWPLPRRARTAHPGP